MKNIKRVEIKNVKHYPSLSQETDCFEANVYLDGKLLGKVVNHGTGGCHEYAMTGDKQKLLEEYARTLPRYKWSDGTSMLRVVDGKSETVEWSHQDADDVINTLFGEWLTKTTLSKELRKGIILTEKGLENGTYELYDRQSEFYHAPFEDRLNKFLTASGFTRDQYDTAHISVEV